MECFKSYFSTITDPQWKLLECYCELLLKWNTKINLISRKGIEGMKEKHILPILPAVELACFVNGIHVLDVGTGGGIPGLILAILFPKIHFTLLDSVQKKINVVADMIRQLELPNAEAICMRLEVFPSRFDVVVGRGVTQFKDFLKLVRPHLKHNGKVAYWTGGNLETLLTPGIKKHTKVFDLEQFFHHQYCESKKILCHNA